MNFYVQKITITHSHEHCTVKDKTLDTYHMYMYMYMYLYNINSDRYNVYVHVHCIVVGYTCIAVHTLYACIVIPYNYNVSNIIIIYNSKMPNGDNNFIILLGIKKRCKHLSRQ